MLSQLRQKKKKEAVRRLSHGRRAGPGLAGTTVRGTFRLPGSDADTHLQPLLGSNPNATTAINPSTLPLFGASTTTSIDNSVFGNAIKNPFGTAEAPGSSQGSPSVFGAGMEAGEFRFGGQTREVMTENTSTVCLFSAALSTTTALPLMSKETPSFAFPSTTGLGHSTSIPVATASQNITPSTGFSAFGSPIFGTNISANQNKEIPTLESVTSSAPVVSQGPFQIGENTGRFTSTFTPVSSSHSVFGSSTFGTGTQVPHVSFGFGKPAFGSAKMTDTTPIGFPVTPTTSASQMSGFPTGQLFGSNSPGFGAKTEKLEQLESGVKTTGKSVFEKPYRAPRSSKTAAERSPEDRIGASHVDILTLKALVIREIPEMYNKNTWLKRFYSRFGEVTKVICNPVKKSATVTFKTHDAAEAAKKKGKILRPGTPPVSIFWKQERKRTSSYSADLSQLPAKKEVESQKTEESESFHQIHMLSDSDLQSLPLAISGGDKFRTLDLIDKKIRQGLKKTTDIAKAEAVRGCCPDMCPEKERYMREDRRRLHTFEIVPGTGSMDENPQIEHAKAIKEYDRPAADKDEPLPHELRPVPVLRMTMDYLVTNIMDTGEGRWSEWFDFAWNRTRGIRKDITQQHLCDPESVDLIEKTARFHIFCAHYLCEEDLMAFDPRINTENLTKCLQTLKHAYVDLYKNQSITCTGEAEFRAYEILMNLNEGSILREAMKYREEILTSPIVRLATSAFQALNSNNFVRFFKLVRSASYLCACILHRYFTQVRSKALRTLNYSLSTSNKEMHYPLTDLVQMLAFENEEKAADFCKFYGLDVTETSVIFMRGTFIEPETKYPNRRATQLIEAKRSYSIGQVVYNGPLPSPPNHQPLFSFDQEGHYIGNYHRLASTQADKENEVPPSLQPDGMAANLPPAAAGFVTQPSTLASSVYGSGGEIPPHIEDEVAYKPTQTALPYNNEEVKNAAKVLFVEVMNEMFVEITSEFMDKVHDCLECSNELVKEIEEEGTTEFITEIAENVILEERRAELLAEHEAALKHKLTEQVNAELVEEVLATETLRVAMDVYSSEQEELYERCKQQATLEVSQELLEDTLNTEVEHIACDTYRDVKAQRKSALREIGTEVLQRRIAKYFHRWLKSYHSLIHVKRLLQEFPAQPPLSSNQEQLLDLIGPRETTPKELDGPSIRMGGDEPKLSRSLQRRQEDLRRLRAEALRPLDIPQLLTDALSTRHTPGPLRGTSAPVDWKLVVSFPGPGPPLCHSSIDLGGVQVSAALLREKFKRGVLPEENRIPIHLQRRVELLSLYRAETRGGPSPGAHYRVCTLACYGVPTNTEMTELLSTRQLQGTAALLVFFRIQDLDTHAGTQELQMRVKRLIQSKPAIPPVPVLLLVLDDGVTRDAISDDSLLREIGSNELVAQSLVSSVRIQRVPSVLPKHDLDRMLKDCVAWLGSHPGAQLDVGRESLKNFIEEGLQRYFFTPLYEDMSARKKARLGEQCPEAVVSLYNATIEHLAAVASSSRLSHVSWPIAEFSAELNTETPPVDWNSEANLSALQDIILSYRLPPPPPGAENGTWDAECALCVKYVERVPACSCPLLTRVTWILDRKYRALEAIDYLSNSPQPTAAEVPWTRVLESCISSMMTSLHSDPVSLERGVFYLPGELEQFVQPLIWRDSVDSSKQDCAEELHRSRLQPSSPPPTRDSMLHDSVVMVDQEMDILCGAPIAATQVSVASRQSPKGSEAVYELNKRLGSALLEAREEIESFDSMLRCLVQDDPTLKASYAKKRKADSCAATEVLEMKSSRYCVDAGAHVDDMPQGITNRRSNTIQEDLEKLRERIRNERKCEELIEERLRSYLET